MAESPSQEWEVLTHGVTYRKRGKRMKKQNGYIYRRAGWWVLRYRENLLENGRIVRKQLAKQLAEIKPEHKRLKNAPAEVREIAEDFLRPLNRGGANPQATQTIAEFAKNLFFPMLERQIRQSTLKGYRARWESQLRSRCGDVRLRDFNALSAQRVIDDVHQQSPQMVRSSLAHLKNLLSLMLDEALRLGCGDAAKGNPARLVKIPRAPEGDETHSYSLREVETMLAVLPEPAATVCAVAAFAGLRRSELRGVRWEDYDGEQIMVMRSVWEGFTNEPKTKRSKSPVPVIPRLKAILAAHKLACGNPKSGPMFANGAGKPANLNNVLNREILPVLNRCGVCRRAKLIHADAQSSHEYVRDGSLPMWHGFHSFRRGLASTLYALGVDDVMVQQILRHQNVGVTRRHYIKTVPEQSVSAMAKLEAALCADRALTTEPIKSALPN
jgi:integrase